jgi:hypothetical protein
MPILVRRHNEVDIQIIPATVGVLDVLFRCGLTIPTERPFHF